MILLDTSVVSALAPHNVGRHPGLETWIRHHDRQLFISVVTASEIESGIAKLVRIGAHAKATRIKRWWSYLLELYAERFVPLDLEIAVEAGLLLDRSRAHKPGYADVAIAATAIVHGYSVATDNERHFRPLGVSLTNPLGR